MVSVTPRPLFTPGKDPVPIVQGLAPGPVWTGAENLSPTRIRSQDRPARSQSPYRLSYPAHMVSVTTPKKVATVSAVYCLTPPEHRDRGFELPTGQRKRACVPFFVTVLLSCLGTGFATHRSVALRILQNVCKQAL